MGDDRDFAWLRRTLTDEIDAVRAGTADHNRAKAVAALALTTLKSIEVEAMLRKQQAELVNAPVLGTLPLCAPALPPVAEQRPAIDAPQTASPPTDEQQDEEESDDDPPANKDQKPEPVEHDISEVAGYKAGDRVCLPNGKSGTVKSVTTAGRINVEVDKDGGTYPYSAKHLSHLTTEPTERPRVTSPVVPTGTARFVPGRSASGSRGG